MIKVLALSQYSAIQIVWIAFLFEITILAGICQVDAISIRCICCLLTSKHISSQACHFNGITYVPPLSSYKSFPCQLNFGSTVYGSFVCVDNSKFELLLLNTTNYNRYTQWKSWECAAAAPPICYKNSGSKFDIPDSTIQGNSDTYYIVVECQNGVYDCPLQYDFTMGSSSPPPSPSPSPSPSSSPPSRSSSNIWIYGLIAGMILLWSHQGGCCVVAIRVTDSFSNPVHCGFILCKGATTHIKVNVVIKPTL